VLTTGSSCIGCGITARQVRPDPEDWRSNVPI
jgi:hypothetical protein